MNCINNHYWLIKGLCISYENETLRSYEILQFYITDLWPTLHYVVSFKKFDKESRIMQWITYSITWNWNFKINNTRVNMCAYSRLWNAKIWICESNGMCRSKWKFVEILKVLLISWKQSIHVSRFVILQQTDFLKKFSNIDILIQMYSSNVDKP